MELSGKCDACDPKAGFGDSNGVNSWSSGGGVGAIFDPGPPAGPGNPPPPPGLWTATNRATVTGGTVNLGSGNLSIKLGVADGGSMTPRPFLIYNAIAAAAGSLGYGWTGAFRDKIQTVSGTAVNLITSNGEVFPFSNFHECTSGYDTPSQSGVTLVKLPDGWQATDIGGTERRFDAGGKFTWIQTPSGSR